MKKLLIAVAILLLLLVIGVMVVASQAGSLIKNGVERYGPDFTGTPVTVSAVDLSILSGQASIRNLVVGNPKGFQTPNAFKVGEVAIKLDISSLFSDQVRIESILIDGAELTYEQLNRTSNIDVLKSNVMKNTSSGSSASTSESSSSDVKVVIDDLHINGTRVQALASVLGKQEDASMTIPDIHMQDLGQGDSSLASVVDEVVRRITDAATKVAVEELAKRKVQEKIDQKKGELKQKLDDKLGEQLKGLF